MSMHRKRAVAFGTAAVLGLAWLAGGTASASTTKDVTLDGLTLGSDVVAMGRVVETTASATGPQGQLGIHTRVQMEVDRTLVGPPTRTVAFWVHGGRVGNTLRRVVGQARFRVGEVLAIFLFSNSDGDLWPTAMARSKWKWFRVGDEKYLAPSVPLRSRLDARGVPSVDTTIAVEGEEPAPNRPIRQDDFVRRVRAATEAR